MAMILSPSPAFGILGTTGAPASGYKLFSYAAGTTTKQNAFTDSGGGTALPNPIILNTRGDVASSSVGSSTGLWIDPALTYKFVLAPSTDTDPPTNAIWSLDNVVNPVAAVQAQIATYEAQLGGLPVGTILPYGGSTAPAGFLICAGQTVSRTTYATLFALIGTAFGAGDASTTFGIPDLRGRYPLGADNMNGSAAGRVSFAVCGITASTVGQSGGNQNAQQDTLTTVVTPTVVIHDPGHKHAQFYTGNFPGSGVAEGGVANAQGPGTQSGDMNTATATTSITATATAAATVSSALTGTSQNMPPAQVTNYIIYAAV